MIRISSPLLQMFRSSPLCLCNSQTTWERIQEVTQKVRRIDTTTYTWPNPKQESPFSRFLSSVLPSDPGESTEYQRGKAEGYAQGYKEGVKKGMYTTALYGTSLIGTITIFRSFRGEKKY